MATRRAYDLPIRENHDLMVNLASYPFVLEPRYFQSGLSDTPDMWIRQTIADKLLRLQKEALNGLRFKIWDAWRPRAVQENIYQKFRKELQDKNPAWDNGTLDAEMANYVARPDNPDRIPPHASGGAIDLTLVNEDGREIDMGTDFDHFGPEACVDYFTQDNPQIHENRILLYRAMDKEDFGTYIHEWWHFDFGNQMWAERKGFDIALYGEVKSPEEFNRTHAKETDHAIP